MTTPANPKLLYPRQWNQFLGMKKAHIDEMSLEDFLAHWQVSRQDLATICECSIATVNHWFSESKSRRYPSLSHRRRLADAHKELSRMQAESNRLRMANN